MDNTDVLFSVLRAGLHSKPVPESELPDQIEWQDVMRLAKKHTVQGIFMEGVLQLPERLAPPPDKKAIFARTACDMIRSATAIDNQVAAIVKLLKSKGIDSVLLKGQGVARYYPNPGMRHVGDIDIYVGRKAYGRAYEACRGLMTDDAQSRPPRTGQHFAFGIENFSFEIHRYATRVYSPIANRRLQAWATEQLERSPERRVCYLDGVEVVLPPLEFDAIYIFYHAWRHYCFEGVGLRQICDWAMLLSTKSDELDHEHLVELLRRFGMVWPWRLFACIAVDYLGVPAEKVPLYDPACARRSAQILDDILASGNFGYYSSDVNERYTPPSTMAAAWRRLKKITRQFCALLPIVPAEAFSLLFARTVNGSGRFVKRLFSRP